MIGGTVKCRICGEPYKWYGHTVADQSACPKCVRKAEENSGGGLRKASGWPGAHR